MCGKATQGIGYNEHIIFIEFIHRIKMQGDLYMKAVGLVTEYNPFHNGHLYHLNKAMELTGADISVAVMSGDFVQRGEPAVLDKYTRASMALNSGVNLVVELPVNYAVSSAENFAAGALKVLDYIKADSIAFGSESGDIERLSKLAHVLCDNEDTLYKEISKYTANGISYAAARQKTVEKLTDKDTAAMLTSSNNILAVEYLKAVTDKELYQANDTVCVTVQLKNTGKRTGKEVIQVYMRDVVSSVMTPVKQLKGFRKVDLLPGQTRETTIMIPVHEFYLTDDLGNRYLESGKFELQVGTSSDRIYFNLPVYIGSSGKGGQTVSGTSFKSRTDGKVIQVKGTVRDIQATPLARVKVQSEESGESALTDYRGTYTIKVKDNGRLIFSKKGFADKTIEVERQTDVSIQMAKGE